MVLQRVLIAGLSWKYGGRETFVMDLYRRIDRSKIQFDFINCFKGKPFYFEDEIRTLGGRIFFVPMLRDGAVAHYRETQHIFQNTGYKALYYHANKKLKNDDLFRAAYRHHVPLRILHSHNSADIATISPVQKLREQIASASMNRYVTHRLSCSRSAGEWMFGKNADFQVVNNGIETALFAFDPAIRLKVREREHTGSRIVYGTVARLNPEKNPLFLIDVFREIHRLQPESVFWHIGGGEMEAEVRRKIAQLGLTDSYLLLGQKDNVNEYLQAFDLFLLPSVHEGFPITLVEAQTAGLCCLVADTVTPDVDLTGLVSFCPLTAGPAVWAKQAIERSESERRSFRKEITDAGFDISARVEAFERMILDT